MVIKKNVIQLLSILLVIFSSCENNFLDIKQEEQITLENAFEDVDKTRSYLAYVYSWLPMEANFADDGAFRSPFTGGCDEMEIAYGDAFSHLINSGAFNATSVSRIRIWWETYNASRQALIVLENLDKVPNISTDDYNSIKGEAIFLNAFSHFLAFRTYGPIPMVDHVVRSDEDWYAIVREDVDYCSEKMVEWCDKAAELLPETRESTDYGRPVKASALALKSRMLLFCSSPLYNGNSELSELKDPISGENLIPQTYDANKWKQAADAAKECIAAIESAGFGLYYSDSGDPKDNYEEIFTTNWNKEILFARNMGYYFHHIWCSDPISQGHPSIFNPTQEMVDAYQMSNGISPIIGYKDDGATPIINPESGYVEEGYTSTASSDGYWPAGIRNMYVKREPRFYASINFSGQVWKLDHTLEFWYYGKDGKYYAGSDYCKTGYLMRKHNPISFTANPYKVSVTTWNYFRVAEIYLNYAEALNESQGPVADVHKYINAVRNRSGLPDIHANLTQDEMRNVIKHERRIELAFENHRYFDVRRWKDAPDNQSGYIHSMNIYAGSSLNDDEYYKRITVEKRVFENPKHYFFPIEQEEIDKNPDNLVQNLDWY